MLKTVKAIRIFQCFVTISLLLYVTTSYGKNTDDILSGNLCETQIRKTLSNWDVASSWQSLISTDEKDRFLGSIPGSFGQWAYIEIEKKTDPVVILSKQSQSTISKVTFSSTCVSKKQEHVSSPLKNRFTDRDLAKLMKKEKDFLVYIWAPEMPLSFSGLEEIKSYAKSQKLPLHVFLYDGSSEQYAKTSGQVYRFPASHYKKIDSFDLRVRGINTHQPVVVRYKNGSVLGRLLFGYKSRHEYAQVYKGILK